MASKGEEEGFGTIKLPEYERKLIAAQSRTWRCSTCDATNEELLSLVDSEGSVREPSREHTSHSSDDTQAETGVAATDTASEGLEDTAAPNHAAPTAASAADAVPSASGVSSAVAPPQPLTQRTSPASPAAPPAPRHVPAEPASTTHTPPFNPVSVAGIQAARVEACKRTLFTIDSTMGAIIVLLVLLLVNCIIG